MKKDDIIQMKIEDFSTEGLGIGHAEGMAVFVKDTVIGDEIRAKIIKTKKTYAYGRLMEVLQASPDRVEPVCPVARQCGGCQLQAMDYQAQLRFKQNKVRSNLMRIGGFGEELLDRIMGPVIGMEEPFHYRNKAQFPIGTDREGRLVAGFYAGRTHSIIDNHDCALGIKENRQILEMILEHMRSHGISAYDEASGKGLVRHVMIRSGFRTGQIMVCLILNGRKLPAQEELVRKLSGLPGVVGITLNINQDKTNVILGRETRLLWGQEYIEDYIGDVKYQISPLSFYQVNPVQTEKLYGTALEYAALQGNETVWDLYCGIGTISLFLAQKAGKVYGVEIVPEAIDDARRNASLNHFENTEFYVGKAEEVLPEKYEKEGITADVIVIDPPRKGCEEAVLDTMVRMAPDRIVYVSCDSATLARDLKYLCGHGYELKRVRATDMFPMSVHVETVALLTRKSQ
ncbi:MAG: 23S rRNA (uracil(1939)-C(5))-methyltransferase RlmD [Lachnospiraceae bacterium]|nr:23S rRNA (uracil(1939)-C(5))-methyltransferase RlmD [Lachnospiraceae bacterium]